MFIHVQFVNYNLIIIFGGNEEQMKNNGNMKRNVPHPFPALRAIHILFEVKRKISDQIDHFSALMFYLSLILIRKFIAKFWS